MSPWSVLLRVLLALALVFNGVGPVMAGVGVDDPQLASHAAHLSALNGHDAPCHEMGARSHAPKARAPAQRAGCCKFGTCRCDAVQQAPIAMATTRLPPAVFESIATVRTLGSAHPAPPLPYPVRPPIV